MVNFTSNTYQMKREILSFSNKISKHLSKPDKKFSADMTYGMLAAGSCLLTDVVEQLHEDTKADLAALPETERKILSLVANRLLCATGEKHLYETVKAELACGGYTFATSGKSVLKNGWKDFEDAFKRSFKTTEDKEQEDKKLPELSEGQTFDGGQTKISEHYTTPPKHYTEAICCERGIRNRP